MKLARIYIMLVIVLGNQITIVQAQKMAKSQVELDSLQAVVDSDVEDSIKIYAMADLAAKIIFRDPTRATKLASSARIIAQQSNNLKLEAECTGILGIGAYISGDFDSSIVLMTQKLTIYQEMGWKKETSEAMSHLGNVLMAKGELEDAMAYYEKGLSLDNKLLIEAEKLDNLEEMDKMWSRISVNNMNVGMIHRILGNYDVALKYYMKSVTITEKLLFEAEQAKDSTKINIQKEAMGTNFGNLGIVYSYLQESIKALDYYDKSLKYFRIVGNKVAEARQLTNSAIIYSRMDSIQKAKQYITMALQINMDIARKEGIAVCYSELGNIHFQLKEYEQAEKCWLEVLSLTEISKGKNGQAIAAQQLGMLYLELNKTDLAEDYLLKSENFAREYGSMDLLKDIYEDLSTFYERQLKFNLSLDYYKLYNNAKDSLFNESKSKEIGKLEANYEMEQKLEKEKRREEAKQNELEEKRLRKDTIQYSGIFIFVLALFVTIFFTGKFTVSEKFAEGLIFFTFLLFFEFCLVLLDPIIDKWSRGEPAYKLILNAFLAGAIFPLHNFFENSLKRTIIK